MLGCTAGVLALDGCSKTPDYRPPTPLSFATPAGFPAPPYDFSNMLLSEEGFQLGKKLFFDGRLSIDGNYPCASCHEPRAAFTTFEHDRSHGYNHSHTLRNAPGLFNLAWYPAYRWDGSGRSLEEVALAHITAPTEMAGNMGTIISRLQDDTAYRRLFRAAYGIDRVTQGLLLNALSQYVVSLVSADARYDKVKRGETVFTPEEASGYATFLSKCNSCHKEPLFTDFSYRNTGLSIDPLLNDLGRYRVTGRGEDSLKFRVPGLRNVDLTSYYGHDGRMSFFRIMIQHYESGIVPYPNNDPLVKNGIPLTTAEENNLVAFLRTLTDSAFLNNPRFKP